MQRMYSSGAAPLSFITRLLTFAPSPPALRFPQRRAPRVSILQIARVPPEVRTEGSAWSRL